MYIVTSENMANTHVIYTSNDVLMSIYMDRRIYEIRHSMYIHRLTYVRGLIPKSRPGHPWLSYDGPVWYYGFSFRNIFIQ